MAAEVLDKQEFLSWMGVVEGKVGVVALRTAYCVLRVYCVQLPLSCTVLLNILSSSEANPLVHLFLIILWSVLLACNLGPSGPQTGCQEVTNPIGKLVCK